ncbi:class I SAM-dependent methyltransferase [Halorubellus litoreus]|uniref:Class I SAM-dependent methyltransferase n=1 Tax=Halorubellus litoreus TaxID=755308 RepID=A0ABD5VB03_9EURY
MSGVSSSPDRTLSYVYDASYAGFPNWEVGRPQWPFVWFEERGGVRSPVLDVGCGTGELTLYLTRQGFDVLGVDISSVAIAQAREKAAARGIDARFLVWDALALDELAAVGFSFRTVLDSAMYHVFDDAARDRFVEGLTAVVPSGGLYCVLGDARRPGHPGYGIHPVELRERFTGTGDWGFVTAWRAPYQRRTGANPGFFVVLRRR